MKVAPAWLAVVFGLAGVARTAAADEAAPLPQGIVPFRTFGSAEGLRNLVIIGITQDASGIPYYTEELFLEMMRTGMVRSRKLHDLMPSKMYGQQTDEDLKAMFAYLKTIAPVAHRVDNTQPPTECPRCGLTHGGGNTNKAAEGS